VKYKSLLAEDGYNLALFNLDDAEVIESTVFSAKSIDIKFEPLGGA